MRRKSTASGRASAGTLNSTRRGSASTSMMAAAMTPRATTAIEVCTALWTTSRLPAPMAFAMTTLAPSEMPTKRLMTRLMMGVLAPTAAMPSEPFSVKWPIMMVSMRLLSCSMMLVAATGSAKRGMARQSEPVRIPVLSCMQRLSTSCREEPKP